jgi:hypothetical protein
MFMFIVLHHERRRIIQFAVTIHQIATRDKRQISGAVLWNKGAAFPHH